MNEWPKVAIIVLNYNGWRDTIECLESLQRVTYPNYHVIAVDNGSRDDSVARIKDWANGKIVTNSRFFEYDPSTKPVRVIEYSKHVAEAGGTPEVEAEIALLPPSRKLVLILVEENLGYAGGNNIGIEYALQCGADYVLLLNNDTVVEPYSISAMLEVAQESGASVVGALVRDAFDGRVLFAKSHYPTMIFVSEPQRYIPNKEWWPSDRAEGSAVLISRDLLVERKSCAGYFLDESLFLYCEEVELGMWCRKVGRKTVVTRKAVVYHKVGASSGGRRNPMQFYYITRNRILLARRYLPWGWKLLFHFVYPILRIARAIMYFTRGKREVACAILQGLLDGYKGKAGPKE